MTKDRRIVSNPHPDPIPGPIALEIDTLSYDERRITFAAINEALELCGCWLLDRRPTSFTHVEYRFELQLRSIVDLYAALLAAGLELSRASHEELSMICALRKHEVHPNSLPSVLTIGLRVTFLDDSLIPASLPCIHA
jgi:hypothetical protein